jgi:large subunit ribosomal protein L10
MRPEKQLLLDDIKGKIEGSKALFLTKYQRLDANKTAHFRTLVTGLGGDFEVVRKRILMKAATSSGLTLDADMLEGHLGVVFAMEDPLPLTKAIYKFAEENEETLEVLGGRFEGQIYTGKDMQLIASLPSKDEMRAQLLGTLEAPMSQTLAAMEALLSSVLYCLENKSNT